MKTYKTSHVIHRVAAALVFPACIVSAAVAQTWTGAASDNNWSTSGNWSDSVPLNDGTAIITFAPASQSPSYVDSAWSAGSLTFTNTNALILTGHTLTLTNPASGWITHTGSGSATVDTELNLTLSAPTSGQASGALYGSSAGGLTLSQNLNISKRADTTPNSVMLQLRGTGANNVINGDINFTSDTPSTRILSKTDSGTWTLNGNGNNFTQIRLAHGILKFGSAAALPSTATLLLQAGANSQTPTLNLDGKHLTAASLTIQVSTASPTNTQARITGTGDSLLSISGAITIKDLNGGWAVVSSKIDSATDMTIETGGKLAGTGSISLALDAVVTVSGEITPGTITSNKSAAGTFTFGLSGNGKLDFQTGSSIKFDLGATPDASDRIVFATAGDWLSGSGNATLDLTAVGTGINYNATYIIFENVTTAGFVFSSITGYDAENYTAQFARVGNNYQLSFVSTAIPEPSLVATLLAVAGLSCALLRRRK